MIRLIAKTRVAVWGHKNAWSLSPPTNGSALPTHCDVTLEIQGDAKGGFNFIMSPEGFFTADTWSPTIDEAYEDGERIFNVNREDWQHA